MADLVKELNSLDFGLYIGGPLQPAVARTSLQQQTKNETLTLV